MDLANNLLITGPPGIGKSTLIRRVCDAFGDRPMAGFVTREIRRNGERRGFELVGLDGRTALLSHVDVKSPFRVGKYGVDVGKLDRFLNHIQLLEPATELVVIDEIGKMECFSALFREMTQAALASDKKVVASVAHRGGGFIAEVKERWDVRLQTLTWENRDHILPEILAHLI
ncbi:MAG: nucleoside-triphosphatase [Desulfobacterales bacterium]|jgi:nucleoside-triphosphatase